MKIILASKSGVKQILDKYEIDNEVVVSNVDEDEIKESLLAEAIVLFLKTLLRLNQ